MEFGASAGCKQNPPGPPIKASGLSKVGYGGGHVEKPPLGLEGTSRSVDRCFSDRGCDHLITHPPSSLPPPPHSHVQIKSDNYRARLVFPEHATVRSPGAPAILAPPQT